MTLIFILNFINPIIILPIIIIILIIIIVHFINILQLMAIYHS